LNELGDTFDKLAKSPHMGRNRSRLAPELRSHPHGRYVIFYRVIDGGIEIVRVLHASRDIFAQFR